MLHRIMMDMTQEIGEMAEQMSRGDLTGDSASEWASARNAWRR